MDSRTKYCRYKGYVLQVQRETPDKLYAVTGDWDTGTKLNLVCHDRDHFTQEIEKRDLDCIFSIRSADNFYDSISVELGSILVSNSEKKPDNLFSEYVMNGEFAKYKGQIFRSYSGYAHDRLFKLASDDEHSQSLGFIMEKPGVFNKCVSPGEIGFAFNSGTFCNYKGKEFNVIDAAPDGTILIVPYDKDLYSKKELLEIGFEIKDSYLAKWLEPGSTDKLWTRSEKIFDFEKYEVQDKVLFEK